VTLDIQTQPAADSGSPTRKAGDNIGAYTLRLLDRFGNVVTGDSLSQIEPRLLGAGGDLILPAGSNGKFTVSAGVVSINDLQLGGLLGEDYNIEFVASSLGLVSTQSNNLQVTFGNPTGLRIDRQPASSYQVASPMGIAAPLVRLVDVYGNHVSSHSEIVVTAAISSNRNPATLAGTFSATISNGTATFEDLQLLATPGTNYFLTFTSTGAYSFTSATSNAFQVAAGAPASLAVLTQPFGGPAGGQLLSHPMIEIRDAAGNRVTTGTYSFQVQLNTGGAAGSLTTAQARFSSSEGQLEFSGFTVSGTADIDFSFTITSDDVAITPALSVTTNNFKLAPGTAKRIQVMDDVVMSSGDLGGVVGDSLTNTVRVRLLDLQDNVATNDSFTKVIVELVSSDPNAYLVGTKIRTVQAGVVSFPGLKVIGRVLNGSTPHTYQLLLRTPTDAEVASAQVINNSNSTRDELNAITNSATLSASDQVAYAAYQELALQAWASNEFVVNPGAAARLQFEPAVTSQSILNGSTFSSTPVIRAYDAWGNFASTATGNSIRATVVGGTLGALTGSASVNLASGVATFTGLGLVGSPDETYSVVFSAGGSVADISFSATVMKRPSVTLSYANRTYAPPTGNTFPTSSPTLVTETASAQISYSVTSESTTVCSVNPSTGVASVLGAGTCVIDVEISQNGRW
jgi:hypothetical protein